MFSVRKLILLGISLLLVGTLSLSVSKTEGALAAPPAPQHIVYNLYATDGYISMADGTQVYIYGFVGGRDTEGVVYQNSVKAPPGAPKTYVPGGLVSQVNAGACGGNWPAPTANLACEAQLAGNAQYPAPVIRAAVGDTVEIRLKNLGVTNRAAPNDPHSIHLHGLDVNAANDGVPETSLGAAPANLPGPGAGNVIVYMFTPTHAGSYMYHCHQEADIHVQMGMFGALVVYDRNDAAYANWLTTGQATGGGNLWGWNWDKEYILLLSEFDILQHQAEQFAGAARGYNPVNFKPQYWFINGLSFPQTIHVAPPVVPPGTVNWFNDIWLPAHKGYDPFIQGSVGTGDKVLLRVINMGFQTQPMHMHGFHGKIIGSDQRAWPWANAPAAGILGSAWGGKTPTGEGMEKNTLTIGSGETYEWLLDFGTWTAHGAAGTYPDYTTNPDGTITSGGTQSRYYDGTVGCQGSLQANNLPIPAAVNTPVSNLATGCPAIPDPFVPPFTYIGGPQVGPVLPGDEKTVPGELLVLAGVTQFQGQLFPFHNHDDYKATNNGVYPGGMFTMIATVP